jgi:hypothetical protein
MVINKKFAYLAVKKHLMNETCSYDSKANKNKEAGVLMHSFACKYYFLIAILNGEPPRFEPRPHLKASSQTQLKIFFIICFSCHPQWCSGFSAGNLCRYPRFKSLRYHIFFPLALTIKSFVFTICISFLLIL